MPRDDMYEIGDDPNILTKYFDFDVFYKSHGHFGLYKKKGASFDGLRVKSGKLPEHLFISRNDRIHLVKEQTKRLNEALKNDLKKDPVRAKSRLSEVVAVTLTEPRVEVLEDMKDTIDIVVEEYLTSPDGLTTWRPYKEPMAPHTALNIIKEDVEADKLDNPIFKEFAYSVIGLTS